MTEQNEELGMFVFFPTHYLDNMTCRQAVLMGMIIGMAKKSGYAYPSNKTISKILNMTVVTIQRELAILEEKGFLTRQLIRNEMKQVISRRIYPTIKFDRGVVSELGGGVMTDLILPSSQICNSNKDNNININNKDIQFEKVWSLYLKKGNKQTSLKAFMKLREDEIELIMTYIPKYIDNHTKNEKMPYLPHLTTFINQKRWNDELPYGELKQVEPTRPAVKYFNPKDYEL